MLASLFGDLGSDRRFLRGNKPPGEAPNGFAETALVGPAAALDAANVEAEAPHRTLWIEGSPTEALRSHLRRQQADDADRHRLALLDPLQQRAAALLRVLADTTGAPLERLQLRQHGSGADLGWIERTTVRRRHHQSVKLYLAGATASGGEADLSLALMERSQLAAVLLDGVMPAEAEACIRRLEAAVQEPGWRCPRLVFVLPPQVPVLAERITGGAWSDRLRVEAVTRPLRTTSALWNALLGIWEEATPPAATPVIAAEPTPAFIVGGPSAPAAAKAPLDESQAGERLRWLVQTEGVTGVALLDTDSGRMIAGEQPDSAAVGPDLGAAAAAGARAWRGQQLAVKAMGWLAPMDELVLSAGACQLVLRPVLHRPGLCLLALLDRNRASLALVRFRLMEADKHL
jgi:hypothetical protein